MKTILAIAAVALAPLAASAGIVPIGVTITSTNSGNYGTQTGPQTVTSGDMSQAHISGGTPSSLYDIQFAQQTIVTPDGGFLFTTSWNAKGNVSGSNDTKVTLNVTNNTAQATSLRFDSQILPGHIGAREGTGSNGPISDLVEYLLNISLDGNLIFSNYGEATKNLASITGYTVLNGATEYHSSDGHDYAADWGATNINLDLGSFAPGQTKTLVYDSYTAVDSNAPCDVLATCSGLSVTFGDPTHSGGIVGANAVTGKPGSSVIGFQVNPFLSYVHVVDSRTPLPAAPPPPVIPNYTPAAVPEPAAFGLFALGLAALARRLRA